RADRRALFQRHWHSRLPLQRRHLHHPRRSFGHQRNQCTWHNTTGQIVGNYTDGNGAHGFLEITVPNPPPAGATTADLILRGSNTSPAVAGQYEIYDIGNNAILAGYSLATIGTDWQFAGLGRFFGSDTTDMV